MPRTNNSMISSAVVIPEQNSIADQNHKNDSPQLKRKLSFDEDHVPKRPKINIDTLDYGDKPNNSSPENASKSAIPRSASAALKPVSAVEEKKRSQRLFGSLLGTLSQSIVRPNAAHRKRDEFEARQRERLKREHEEQDAEHKRKRDDLFRSRKRQQQKWDADAQKLRNADIRANACFLKTTSEPVLYYLPFDIRDNERVQILRQKDEAEALIRELSRHPHGERSMEADLTKHENDTDEQPNGTPNSMHAPDNDPAQQKTDKSEATQELINADEGLSNKPDENTCDVPDFDLARGVDDNHGEELVEGQEDDLIY